MQMIINKATVANSPQTKPRAWRRIRGFEGGIVEGDEGVVVGAKVGPSSAAESMANEQCSGVVPHQPFGEQQVLSGQMPFPRTP